MNIRRQKIRTLWDHSKIYWCPKWVSKDYEELVGMKEVTILRIKNRLKVSLWVILRHKCFQCQLNGTVCNKCKSHRKSSHLRRLVRPEMRASVAFLISHNNSKTPVRSWKKWKNTADEICYTFKNAKWSLILQLGLTAV